MPHIYPPNRLHDLEKMHALGYITIQEKFIAIQEHLDHQAMEYTMSNFQQEQSRTYNKTSQHPRYSCDATCLDCADIGTSNASPLPERLKTNLKTALMDTLTHFYTDSLANQLAYLKGVIRDWDDYSSHIDAIDRMNRRVK